MVLLATWYIRCMTRRGLRSLVAGLCVLAGAAASYGIGACSGIGSDTTTTTVAAPFITIPASGSSSTASLPATASSEASLESYRAGMQAWADAYGPALQRAYAIVNAIGPIKPTEEQVRAAEDLQITIAAAAKELERMRAPPGLSRVSADFLASLQSLAGGAYDLAEGLQQHEELLALAAVGTMKVAWEEGELARTVLEEALGFSLLR